MENLVILAQAVTDSTEPASEVQYVPLDFIWEQIITLTWLQAIIAISFGVVYLLYGWRIFKVLVMICFGLIGLFVGIQLGSKFEKELLGGIIGLFLLAGVSIPLMRWAVSMLGAIAGGILSGGVWYAFELPQKYIWAGAIIGMVAGGMIAFIAFKVAVMLFTSLSGGALIVTGMLALFYQYESIQQPPTENVRQMLYNHNWFMPVLLLVPTFIGIVVQNKLVKGSRGWAI
jgi:hypothetical protein